MEARKEIVLKRAELYDLIWSKPIISVAKEFGVSDVGLAKICRRMEIPRPPRGYWQKEKLRPQSVIRPLLRPLSNKGKEIAIIKPTTLRSKYLVLERPDVIPVPDVLLNPHPLIEKTLRALTKGRVWEYGILSTQNKICLDIRVSRGSLARACRVMDTLIKGLEYRGYSIGIQAQNSTVVNVEGEQFEIAIDEKLRRTAHEPTPDEKKRYSQLLWLIPKYDYEPSSELVLKVRSVYGSKLQRSDGKRQRIENCLGAFIIGLKTLARRKKYDREERERWHREWEAEQKRREEMRRLALIEERRAEKLTVDARRWALANEIRNYLSELSKLGDEIHGLEEWIRWGEAYVQRIDPLMTSSTIVFMEKQYKSPGQIAINLEKIPEQIS